MVHGGLRPHGGPAPVPRGGVPLMAAVMDKVVPGTGRPVARRWPRRAHVGLTLALAAVVAGLLLPTERYLTPRHGIGYALGIAGGLMMLCLLIYPLRKRKPSLSFLGSVRAWFRVHMVLGVMGPIAILYHANFHLGATNSNVALACMLVVAGSGLVGRYLYARIHHGLYGRRATLKELAGDAERLRAQTGALQALPGLVEEITLAERRIGRPAWLLLRPLLAAYRQRAESRRLKRLVRLAIAVAASSSPTIAQHRRRLVRVACSYVDARLTAARRVAEFEASERLFAAWHVLHMPLFLMLVVVGIVHVFAVHLY